MAESQEKKRLFAPRDLTKGKEWKVIALFTVPIAISYFLQQIYTITDAIICGQVLSVNEVAGINDVSSMVFVFLQFVFGCTAGFSVITSRKIGEGDEEGVRKSFATQIVLSFIISVVITAIALLCLNPMLSWINVTKDNPEVYDAAHLYCAIIFGGIIAQMFYNFICSILRGLGDSMTPLVFLIISTALNIGLDLLFTMGFKWGVAGAASATVTAQAVSAIGCFIYTFARYKELRLKRSDFKLTRKDVSSHLSQGLPLGLQFSVLAIGLIVMQGEIIKFDIAATGEMVAGNPAQNGYGAACKLGNLLMSPMNALGTAMISFCSQNEGAGEKERIRKGVWVSTLMLFIVYVVVAGIGLLLTINGAYLYMFLSSDKVIEATITFGNTYLYLALPCYFFLGIIFLWRGIVQGLGKSGFVFLAGCVELGARILVCLLLPAAVNGGAITADASLAAYIAVAAADPIAWFAADLLLLIPILLYAVRRGKKSDENKMLGSLDSGA